MLGLDVVDGRKEIRQNLGVVFQSPGLDRQLTAEENLWHHGRLFGIGAADLRERIANPWRPPD